MSTIVSACGYCEAREQTFDVLAPEMQAESAIMFGARCRHCRKVSNFTVTSGIGSIHSTRDALNKNDDATKAILIKERVPLAQDPAAPAHVPSEVAKSYIQAEKLIKSKDMSEPAAVMYGRTVELALEKVAQMRSTPLAGSTLVKRIDDAAAKNLLPNDLAEWAHEVRQLRNDGAHVNAVNHNEVLELQGFVELLLRYLFTLPGIMADRRLKKTTPVVSSSEAAA